MKERVRCSSVELSLDTRVIASHRGAADHPKLVFRSLACRILVLHQVGVSISAVSCSETAWEVTYDASIREAFQLGFSTEEISGLLPDQHREGSEGVTRRLSELYDRHVFECALTGAPVRIIADADDDNRCTELPDRDRLMSAESGWPESIWPQLQDGVVPPQESELTRRSVVGDLEGTTADAIGLATSLEVVIDGAAHSDQLRYVAAACRILSLCWRGTQIKKIDFDVPSIDIRLHSTVEQAFASGVSPDTLLEAAQSLPNTPAVRERLLELQREYLIGWYPDPLGAMHDPEDLIRRALQEEGFVEEYPRPDELDRPELRALMESLLSQLGVEVDL